MTSATQPPLSFLDQWLDERSDAEFNLGESGVSNRRLDEIIDRESLVRELAAIDFDHNDTYGSAALRDEVAALYHNVRRDNVLVTAGVSEAILVYFLAKRREGANVVVLTPAFHSLCDVPAAIGLEVRPIPLQFENGFALPLDKIVEHVDRYTIAVVLTTPGNPMGTVYEPAEVLDLAERLATSGCDILLDEQYRLLPHDPDLRMFPSAACVTPNIIGFGSPGKCYGTVGLRVGWIIAHEEFAPVLNSAKTLTTHAISKLNDHICTTLLRSGNAVLADNKAQVRRNRTLFQQLIDSHAEELSWIPPVGGTVAFPRLHPRWSSADFAEQLYRQHDVLVLPGEAFDMPGFFRIRLGLESTAFEAAMLRMAVFLSAHKATAARQSIA